LSLFKGHFEGAKTFLTPSIVPSGARDNLRGQKSLGPLKMSLEMAQKVIVPPKKNYIPHFLKQLDINSYTVAKGCLNGEASPQSRQSAKRFSSRWNWDSPTPLAAGECAPPPFCPGGRAHSLAVKGLGESQFQRGDIHCGALYILVLCGPHF
jgi:hypothetical protein